MPLTDLQAKAIKPGETLSEKVGKRGEGVLLLLGRERSVAGYYRYTAPDGGRPWIELGSLSKKNTLQMMRDRCAELSRMRREHPDVKGWLEGQAAQEQAEAEARRRAAVIEAARGTLAELLNDYVVDLEAKGRVSAGEVRKTFKRLVYDSALAKMKARDIGPEEIKTIIAPLSKAGSKVHRNRVRSYLHAAFSFGLRSEHDETRESGRAFGLTGNPVAAIPPLSGVEREGTRSVSDTNLRLFYNNLHSVEKTHVVMVALLRFLIAIGGQRPEQVLAVPWDGYDLKARTIRIIDRKGRGARPRVHLVPLTDRAIEQLEIVRALNPPDGERAKSHPFIARGDKSVSTESLKNVIKRFREECEHGAGIPHFSVRDLRRTAKQIMTRAGIRRDLRNLLQNHGQTGVDAKHYDNDPEAHLPEKRQAMLAYDAALGRVLAGKEIGADVIDLDERRREAATTEAST